MWQSICRLLGNAPQCIVQNLVCIRCVTDCLHSPPFQAGSVSVPDEFCAPDELTYSSCCPQLGEEWEGCSPSSATHWKRDIFLFFSLMHPGQLEGTVSSVVPQTYRCKPKQMKSLDRDQSQSTVTLTPPSQEGHCGRIRFSASTLLLFRSLLIALCSLLLQIQPLSSKTK